jgi:protein subunit release factor B
MSGNEPDRTKRSCIDIVALHGGDESMVFVEMMLTMYSLWAGSLGLSFKVIEPKRTIIGRSVRRARLQIDGVDPAWLGERENGVHSMIRIPEGETRRHMSFVGIRVCGSANAPLPKAQDDWGEQIRSLVTAPYQSLTNRRSGFVCHDTARVLAGDLDRFWQERP